ncbi:hypothetical protein [Neomegalonema sp.]|uniref:hypothetical protein n=1 Tax=Neomegalonema sp. TaxID=2039713 RepID=UPI00262D8041|nr:hypothetical protein [Neomegalonema sp.]MDD2867326.1 hypothetical protein [Neomegalonema sp.]
MWSSSAPLGRGRFFLYTIFLGLLEFFNIPEFVLRLLLGMKRDGSLDLERLALVGGILLLRLSTIWMQGFFAARRSLDAGLSPHVVGAYVGAMLLDLALEVWGLLGGGGLFWSLPQPYMERSLIGFVLFGFWIRFWTATPARWVVP